MATRKRRAWGLAAILVVLVLAGLGLLAPWLKACAVAKHHVRLMGARVERADLTGTRLTRAVYDEYTRWPASFNLRTREAIRMAPGADLANVNLDGAELHARDLTKANLAGSKLSTADLRGAILAGAILTGANQHYAKLLDANLRGPACAARTWAKRG